MENSFYSESSKRFERGIIMEKTKILFLEDDAEMNEHTMELLKDSLDELYGSMYEIIECDRIDLAKKEYLKHKEKICCIITDLNMDDEWIDEKYIEETKGGVLSGWVWIYRCVYKGQLEIINIPTIIYSGFIDELEEELSTPLPDMVYKIRKGGEDDDGFTPLFQKLTEILEKERGNIDV